MHYFARTKNLSVVLSVFALCAISSVAYAWTAPSIAPTGGNTPAPLNVGSDSQFKPGPFGATLGSFDFLGVGTAAPNNLFHVVSSVAGTKAANFQVTGTGNPQGGAMSGIAITNSNNTTSSLGGIAFYGTDSTNVARHMSAIIAGKESTWIGGSGNYGGNLSFWTRPAGGEELNRLHITSNGNVGIGTTNPDANASLQVMGRGTGQDGWLKYKSTGDWQGIHLDNTNITNNSVGILQNNDGSFHIHRWAQGDILYANSGGTITALMQGNVGIGTAGPADKLEVIGNVRTDAIVDRNDAQYYADLNNVSRFNSIHAKEVVVEAGWSADFVFDKNYALKPLSEVEKYIAENKHLPDIPSEKEVVENGVSVGDMYVRLLQKIEELTLYQIKQEKVAAEQEKVIRELKEEVDVLKKR